MKGVCPIIIFGIDPGYAIVGYGVLHYDRNRFTTYAYGAVTTDAGTPFDQRLLKIFNEMERLFEKYQPDEVAIEKLFFTNNKTTGIDVAQARGVILLAAVRRGIPVFEYTPMQVKQAVVGYGKAVKTQVQEMTRSILGLESVPRPDDTADALAMAICHGHNAGSLLGRYQLMGGRS